MNRRSFFALLTAPFVAKLIPTKEVFKHSVTFPIIDEHIQALPFEPKEFCVFLNRTWADKIRAEHGGVLPERYYGFKIYELDPKGFALAD